MMKSLKDNFLINNEKGVHLTNFYNLSTFRLIVVFLLFFHFFIVSFSIFVKPFQ